MDESRKNVMEKPTLGILKYDTSHPYVVYAFGTQVFFKTFDSAIEYYNNSIKYMKTNQRWSL